MIVVKVVLVVVVVIVAAAAAVVVVVVGLCRPSTVVAKEIIEGMAVSATKVTSM